MLIGWAKSWERDDDFSIVPRGNKRRQLTFIAKESKEGGKVRANGYKYSIEEARYIPLSAR